MTSDITWELYVAGSVQGVGFRPFIFRLAIEENVNGIVQNCGNFVKIVIQGSEENLKKFYKNLSRKKPPLAIIEQIEIKEVPGPQLYSEFKIISSQIDSNMRTTSYIPPDITICDLCLEDMLRGDRPERKNYSFTSCVDCGPRYSVIKDVPYDRPFTTMNVFPLCNKCKQEYENPLDRRFHAQTTCCRICGPQYSLVNHSGKILETNEEIIIKKCQEILLNGKILAIKGIGGTHLACRVDKPEIIKRLRLEKGDRKRKPFALMCHSLEEIRTFAEIPDETTLELLTSPRRPIVLLTKSSCYSFADNLAPNLHNIGVMLPYSGFHYQLLNHPKIRTLVMTSANHSHLPIQIDNAEIISSLKNIADYFVLHNRNIYQRNDDSVVKPLSFSYNNLSKTLFIRRSRGYTPEPLNCPIYTNQKHLLGLGSELHTVPAILTQEKLFLTQYIGNLRYESTYHFYMKSIKHLQGLLQNPPLEGIAHDLHPQLLSSEYAQELASTLNIPKFAFQHHFAHASALLADNQIWDEKAIIITADGLGFGSDGHIWGGEVLLCDLLEYKRLDHIAYVPQPGGDLATKYPIRMLLSYLLKSGIEEEELIKIIRDKYPSSIRLNQNEDQIILQQIQKQLNSPLTSSTGRFLDACSFALGYCSETTYEGEPAIVLEGAGWSKRNTLRKNPFVRSSIQSNFGLDFHKIVPLLIDSIVKKENRNELAWHIQEFVGWAFAQKILEFSQAEGINNVGFTGGVAYNDLIIHSFINTIQKENPKLNILLHRDLPPGDGGIGAGQAVLLAKHLIT
ncbi:MAG: carbamoyltransferase HypF [Candidatus Hodarchaeales archaeon]|jgi:hydrogenase maturation protein HypF